MIEKACSTAFRVLKVEEIELSLCHNVFPFLFPTPSYKELRELLSIKAKLFLPDWLHFLKRVLAMWIFCAYLKERKKKAHSIV